MASRIAIVTGSNKGIGLQVVKDLARQFDGLVYLTSRNEELGKKSMAEAQKELGKDGGKLRYHQLDIDNDDSIHKLRDDMATAHKHVDVLVNNAGIAFKHDATEPFAVQAKLTTATNYFNTKKLCDALFPLLSPGARVVNVASRVGQITIKMLTPELYAKVTGCKTAADIDALMTRFVSLSQDGKQATEGYPEYAYGMSKLGLIVLSVIQGKTLAADSRKDILLNCVCPGYVDTEMTANKGQMTVAQGADTIVWLALLPPNDPANPVAKFLAERKVIDWTVGATMEELLKANNWTL